MLPVCKGWRLNGAKPRSGLLARCLPALLLLAMVIRPTAPASPAKSVTELWSEDCSSSRICRNAQRAAMHRVLAIY